MFDFALPTDPFFLQLAFVLLCLAQILHFGQYWVICTEDIVNTLRFGRMKKALDWKNGGAARKKARKSRA